ncbi:class F sortase [Ornithinimicrobium cerasi]|uniref:class F sortase n=1 Tax=Ornithinimicrobium cerasi TaxID=2248773 RepID=UPI001FD61C2E|nr:class F sortase [Ornithinimicrobium cerasi]
MNEDVGRTVTGTSGPVARRPGRMVRTAVALTVMLSGGTAVAVGLSGQGGTPVPPALSAPTGSEPEADAASSTAPSRDAGQSRNPGPSSRTAPPDAASPGSSAAAPSAQAEPTEEPALVALPVSVSIPAIDVTSDLLHLGLNPDGTLEVPEGPDFDSAAWYDGSPRPGQTGPAVIEGHVTSIDSGPSVFFDLARLQVGDTVEVERSDGTVATFEVYDLQQFPKDSFPTVQVYGNTPGPELRLITCGGTIAESTGHFTDNIIVFAREV